MLAREGGLQLAQDVNALEATHATENPPHVTVLGHSYGATTVADAFAASGARANDVILLGSPGTDLAHSAADFHLDGGNVFVGSASSDPMSWLGESGTVPNWLNEALGHPRQVRRVGDGRRGPTRLDPIQGGGPGHDGLSLANHSHYYDLGGEALRSMATREGPRCGAGTDDLLARAAPAAHHHAE